MALSGRMVSRRSPPIIDGDHTLGLEFARDTGAKRADCMPGAAATTKVTANPGGVFLSFRVPKGI